MHRHHIALGEHPEQFFVEVGHSRPCALDHVENRVAPHSQRCVRAVVGDVVGRIQLVDRVELPAVPDLVEQAVDDGFVAFGIHGTSDPSSGFIRTIHCCSEPNGRFTATVRHG